MDTTRFHAATRLLLPVAVVAALLATPGRAGVSAGDDPPGQAPAEQGADAQDVRAPQPPADAGQPLLAFPIPGQSHTTATITSFMDHSARYDSKYTYRPYCPDGAMTTYLGQGGARTGPVLYELSLAEEGTLLVATGRDFAYGGGLDAAQVAFNGVPQAVVERTTTPEGLHALAVQTSVVPPAARKTTYLVTVINGGRTSNAVAFYKAGTRITLGNCRTYDDPAANSYGGKAYDGHPAYDFSTRTVAPADGIIPIVAAATGVVTAVAPAQGKIELLHQDPNGEFYKTTYLHLSACYAGGT